MPKPDQNASAHYQEILSRKGLRFTPQRREVYTALLEQRDHPTATEVFLRVKDRVPSISLATVYNCLESLVAQDLVQQVHVDRGPVRFCPNLAQHGHFFCEECGKVIDVEFVEGAEFPWKLPQNCIVTHQELTLKGICPDCVRETQKSRDRNHRPLSN